ncbi:PulJ/GspJ family protein [Variovorax ginsengisoli]|uniref:General secretion pathway protein J n=1 Tax=Variovorax ginsengisoli TaxID=363844 RepID=A0ABT9SB48_9BURK|nr:prepilin-type N-terminal cleavage/methylation domain-containing protein [Variovorax ginsengisoli]MDP9900577.1 general secretion pathway protein J [Variovorax ginsengisoli]
MQPRQRAHGFTLIELMVAIAAMALLALMSWRGVDGMTRTQGQMRERGDAVLTLQTALSQWGTDLDAIAVLPSTQPIDWNGRAVRLTRTLTDGVQPLVEVVAWTVRNDAAGVPRWYRWASPTLRTRGDWQQAWERAASWAENGDTETQGTEVALMPLQGWQLQYFRNNLWQPATGADASGTTTSTVPDGVRVVLDLPQGNALAGEITRDWVKPNFAVTAPRQQ